MGNREKGFEKLISLHQLLFSALTDLPNNMEAEIARQEITE